MYFFKTFVLAAALSFTAQAAPVSNLEERDSINDCYDSSFENQTSDASPLVSDCQQIAVNIADGGTWSTGDAGYQRQLVQYGTCALGVSGDFQAQVFYVGNQDIIDVRSK